MLATVSGEGCVRLVIKSLLYLHGEPAPQSSFGRVAADLGEYAPIFSPEAFQGAGGGEIRALHPTRGPRDDENLQGEIASADLGLWIASSIATRSSTRSVSGIRPRKAQGALGAPRAPGTNVRQPGCERFRRRSSTERQAGENTEPTEAPETAERTTLAWFSRWG